MDSLPNLNYHPDFILYLFIHLSFVMFMWPILLKLALFVWPT